MSEWKKIKEDSIWDGWRKLVSRTYVCPDGEEHTYEVVNGGTAVCVLPLTADNKVVLAYQFRPGPDTYLGELPGGLADEGENLQEAAARELLEETGYSGELEPMGSYWTDAYSSQKRHHFLARNCQKTAEPQMDPNESIEIRLVSVEEFKEQLDAGALTDCVTAYKGLQRANLL